jgi:hypothetical protein
MDSPTSASCSRDAVCSRTLRFSQGTRVSAESKRKKPSSKVVNFITMRKFRKHQKHRACLIVIPLSLSS